MKSLTLACLFLCSFAYAQTSVYTRSFNNTRTSANLSETTLTPASLQANSLRLKCTMNLSGDLRGTEGQPLIVSDLTMSDGLSHNVLFTASMADDVFAFDASTCAELWRQHVANPIPDTRALDMWLIQDHWGILSTGVIDPVAKVYYVVSMSSPTGQEANSKFMLHGLSLLDGHQVFTPLDLTTATYTNSLGTTVKLGSVPRKQRPGLALVSENGASTVFIAFGSFVESASTNQGWVIAVNTSTLATPKITAAFASTSHYSGGGIWMAGQAPSIGPDGDVYVTTGNGGFDGATDFSESLLRLHYSGVALTPLEWFSPFSDTGRVGDDATLADRSLAPGDKNQEGGPTNAQPPSDQDLGSAGNLMLPMALTGLSKDIDLSAGKDGILYEVDANAMGKDTNLSFSAANIPSQVYGKLLAPAYGFTYYPDMNLEPTNLSQLQTTPYGYTHHQHSTPAYYKSPVYGPMLFTGGENGPVRAFSIHSDFSVNYLATGNDYASQGMAAPGGMPGSMLSLSTNGLVTNSCIIWATQPVGNANMTITPGYLVAYACDAFNDGLLVKLFDSRTAGITWNFNKFDPPVAINGAVYVPTYDGRILVLSQ